MYYLSFDLGTTKIKSTLFNNEGDIIYFSQCNSKIYNDNGVFQKPDDFLNLIISHILDIKAKKPKQFSEIEYFITSGQMGGILGVDENLDVIIPWTYSVDSRYLEDVYRLEYEFGKHIREKSGGPPTISGKMLWIKRTFPGKYRKVCKFINLMCYISLKLCNLKTHNAFIDCTCLSMSGIADILNLKWDNNLCEKAGIDIKKLPKITLPFEEIGIIKKDRFETKKDIKVLAGCGDQVAGFIGSGIIFKNNIIDVSGTYNLIGFCCNNFFGDSKFEAFHSIYSGIGDIYYQLAVISAGGITFNWFKENFNYNIKKSKKYYKIPSNLFIIPYLGGRYSPTQPYFRGSFLNLKWQNTLDDMYISLLESGGYELNSFIDKLCELNNLTRDTFKEIKIIGSGSNNEVENFIKANILDLNYLVLEKKPYENIGTFIIAKYKDKAAIGVNELLEKGVINAGVTVSPDEQIVRQYSQNIKKYNQIVDSLAELYSCL